jgi:hypothetical protein
MDPRAQISRWPAASHAIAGQWKRGDRILVGPVPVVVGQWYIRRVGGIPMSENDISPLPIHDPKPAFLKKLSAGYIRFVALYSTVDDSPDVDYKTMAILRQWTVVFRSSESGLGPSRFTVYRDPAP